MEEILASIRRIISEDGETAPKAAEPEKPKAAAKPAARPEPEPEPEPEEDVLELTDIVPDEDEAPLVKARATADEDVVMVERTPMKSAPKTPVVASRARQIAERDQGLISEEVRERASSSFLQLSRDTLVSETSPADPRSLEALVQDMLRPALEEWLNQNLPSIVERLVQQEIDRVSRKGGRF
jgi:cell pole-organizing protein PopZ